LLSVARPPAKANRRRMGECRKIAILARRAPPPQCHRYGERIRYNSTRSRPQRGILALMRAPNHPRRSSPSIAPSLSDWLNRSQPLDRLMQTATSLAKLQAQVHALLPPGIRSSVAAAGLREEHPPSADQTLVLHVSHSAAAARVRQIVPSVLQALERQGSRITAIRVRVQPPNSSRDPWHVEAPRRTKQANMTPRGLASLSALAASLEDSPLKAALQQMLDHHQQS
jgi:hypothetical protein